MPRMRSSRIARHMRTGAAEARGLVMTRRLMRIAGVPARIHVDDGRVEPWHLVEQLVTR